MGVKVLQFPAIPDDQARLYAAVRDLVWASNVSQGMRVATLELIKFEILRDMQETIDAD